MCAYACVLTAVGESDMPVSRAVLGDLPEKLRVRLDTHVL